MNSSSSLRWLPASTTRPTSSVRAPLWPHEGLLTGLLLMSGSTDSQAQSSTSSTGWEKPPPLTGLEDLDLALAEVSDAITQARRAIARRLREEHT